MKKVYFLSTCDTCKRVLDEIDIPATFIKQDIKKKGIEEEELQELFKLAGSYEALFSKRAKLYQERGLKHKNLSEDDFKKLILEHYTFLKRPIIVKKDEIFIGSTPKNIAAAKKSIHSH